MPTSSELPGCDELFLHFFDRWYDERAREQKEFKATRPDMLQDDALKGITVDEASPLGIDGQGKVRECLDGMLDAVRGAWPGYLNVSGALDLKWIDAFDRHYDQARIAEIIKTADEEEFGNDYVVLCCEFGVALGYVLRSLEPRLLWQLNWPYWESSLVDPKSGNVIPVFHWAIKKMSGYGWEDGFAAKVNACLEVLDQG